MSIDLYQMNILIHSLVQYFLNRDIIITPFRDLVKGVVI